MVAKPFIPLYNIFYKEIFKKILAIDSDSFGKWEKVIENPIMRIQKIKVFL